MSALVLQGLIALGMFGGTQMEYFYGSFAFPYVSPHIVRRKHRESATSFDSDPEEAVEVKHISLILLDAKNHEKERSTDDNKQNGMKRKNFNESPNQFHSFGCKIIKKETIGDVFEHVVSSAGAKETPVGDECSLATVEDSDSFDFDDWVQQQMRAIRKIADN